MTHDPDQPEIVAKAANDVEAAAIVAFLDAAGVRARAVGAFTAGFRAEAPGDIQIVVASQDRERAEQALAERR